MYQKYFQNLSRLPFRLGQRASAPCVLFEFRKNRTSHFSTWAARSSLIHSYGNEFSDDRTDYLARFRLQFEPFVKYPGQSM